jgi:hypothetical protein
MTNDTTVHAEDVIPVRSRITWGAIIAGSVLALALYFLLTLLGAAVGLSINDRVSDRGLAIGAVIWAILVTAGCLFIGGFVASQLTTGENKPEGALYGILVWSAMFGMLLLLMATGVRAGFNALVGLATPASNVASNPNANWEAAARQRGATDADIERFRASINSAPASVQDAIRNPENRQLIEENATRAAWYSFGGTLISMIAAALGGLVGAGPTIRLFTIQVRRNATVFNRRDTYVKT